MTFIFEFSEADTETLRCLLRDCVGVDVYNGLVSSFFVQMGAQMVGIDKLTKREYTWNCETLAGKQ